MMKRINQLYTNYFLLISLFLLLGACSSDDDVVPPPNPPAVAAIPSLTLAQSKVFRFTWTDVSDATFYRLLENPDGTTGFTQVGDDTLQGVQTQDHIVALHARVNAQYILQSCNTTGCKDSVAVRVSGTLVAAIGFLKASNTEGNDLFGDALSLSADGNTLAVGATNEGSNATGIDGNEADNSAPVSGAVYIFTRNGNSWNQQAYIKASNTNAGDFFGTALSLSTDGNTLAVGATLEASNAIGIGGDEGNNSMLGSGAVYVFTRSSNTWSQQAYLKASNTDSLDLFGKALSLNADGNTLAVGANGEASSAKGVDGNQADNTANSSGAVYVFTRNANIWSQQVYLKASNTDVQDLFGENLSLSDDGNTLAVGATGEASALTGIDRDDTNNGSVATGAVYVFTRNNTIWSQQVYIKSFNAGMRDFFGGSLSLSADGNFLAVGATGEESNATGIDGDELDNSAPTSGAVYTFTRSGATWIKQAYIKASNTEMDDSFGWSLSMSDDGNTLAVGAKDEASNASGVGGNQSDNSAPLSGAMYTFTSSGGIWSQQAYIKASNTDASDFFGAAQGLSADGNTLVVGAANEDSAAGDQTDNTASNSGAVYLY